ncbi:MAG: hypothetical protein AAFX93_02345 [Verrucomicrobiota bacterium]
MKQYLFFLFVLFALGQTSATDKAALPSDCSAADFLPKAGLVLVYEFYDNGSPAGEEKRTISTKNGTTISLTPFDYGQEFIKKDGKIYMRFFDGDTEKPFELYFEADLNVGAKWNNKDGVTSEVVSEGEALIFDRERKYIDLKVTFPPRSMFPDQDETMILFERYAAGLGVVEAKDDQGVPDQRLVKVISQSRKSN